MVDHTRSAAVAAALVLLLIGVGQVCKPWLSASRGGTLAAGALGSLVFMYALTALSNWQMSQSGAQARAGLVEVGLCLFVAVISSALIHRVAATVCVLFSIGLLYFVNGISHTKYHTAAASSQQHTAAKKKK